MTNETQHNSVSGRVMHKQRCRDKWSPTYEGGLYENAKLRGMNELHRELSREARAILAEETFTDSDGEILRSPDGELAEMWFTRLGLNLEAEDGGE